MLPIVFSAAAPSIIVSDVQLIIFAFTAWKDTSFLWQEPLHALLVIPNALYAMQLALTALSAPEDTIFQETPAPPAAPTVLNAQAPPALTAQLATFLLELTVWPALNPV